MGVRRLLLAGFVVIAACSAEHAADPRDPGSASGRSVVVTASSTSGSGGTVGPVASPTPGPSSVATSGDAASTAAPLVVRGQLIAGVAGAVETTRTPPFEHTDPFSEAVRLDDGTCVGWSGSRGGSTVGLERGAAVVVLHVDEPRELGHGEITDSRWVDMAGGGEQWNCVFAFEARLDAPHAEFRVRVGPLGPWLARPDPAAPGDFVVSVNTDASVAAIEECRGLVPDDEEASTSTAVPPGSAAAASTTAGPVTRWDAVGRFWSVGVRSLCTAGLPVTAIARPCRPTRAGSEYLTEVVDSDDPTTRYANGDPIPAGTRLTVVVPVGRACE